MQFVAVDPNRLIFEKRLQLYTRTCLAWQSNNALWVHSRVQYIDKWCWIILLLKCVVVRLDLIIIAIGSVCHHSLFKSYLSMTNQICVVHTLNMIGNKLVNIYNELSNPLCDDSMTRPNVHVFEISGFVLWLKGFSA